MPRILSDNEILKGINSLNSNQKFNVVHIWDKYYRKHNRRHAESVHIFLSSSGGKSKSHLVKVKYNAITTTVLSL